MKVEAGGSAGRGVASSSFRPLQSSCLSLVWADILWELFLVTFVVTVRRR